MHWKSQFFDTLHNTHIVQGHNWEKITNLEFEVHESIQENIFLATERARINIGLMMLQDGNFNICLSLFGCEEKILYNVRIVHCKKPGPGQSASQGALLEALEGTPLFAWQQPAQLINQLFPLFKWSLCCQKFESRHHWLFVDNYDQMSKSWIVSKGHNYQHERLLLFVIILTFGCLMSSRPGSALNRGKGWAVGQGGVVEGGRVGWHLLQRIRVKISLRIVKVVAAMLLMADVTWYWCKMMNNFILKCLISIYKSSTGEGFCFQFMSAWYCFQFVQMVQEWTII